MSEYDYNQYLCDLGTFPFSVGMLDFADEKYKDKQVNQHVRYMLNRTQQMFVYEGLPDTIPQRMLETILQTCGNVCLTEVEGKPYAFSGGLGGMRDEYYQPTIYTVANPYLNFNAMLKIGVDCVWGRSDSFGVGLIPLFQWYASMIVENGLSLRVGLINSRITKTISAQDDATYKSALKYLQDIEDGKLGAISDSAFFEGLNIHHAPTANEHLTDIIESLQYLKASWFNELGLQANYNMKRERIQNAEAENDNDALLPLIDDMLNQRKEMLEAFNTMYGYEVTVKLSSAWEDVQEDANPDTEETEDTDEIEGAGNEMETITVANDTGDDNSISQNSEAEGVPKVSESTEESPENMEEETPEHSPVLGINVVVNVGDENETAIDGEGVNENVETTEIENTEIGDGVDNTN